MKRIAKYSKMVCFATFIAIFNPISLHATHKNNQNPNFIYIDVHIDQPNVDDCYTNSVQDLLIDMNWIKVYPNPNAGYFTIEVLNPHQGNPIYISVFNSLGVKVYNAAYNSPTELLSIDINLTHLSKGLYIISVQSIDKKATTKFNII